VDVIVIKARPVVTYDFDRTLGLDDPWVSVFRSVACHFPAPHISIAFLLRTPSQIITRVCT
jgi:hypothetical protein